MKHSTKKKIKDSLLANMEGGETVAASEPKRVKHTPSGWADEKDKLSSEFKMSEELKQGVVRDRSCTDIFCLLIFAAFLVLMFVVVAIGFKSDQIGKLMAPVDHAKQICGFDTSVKDYPYLFFPNFRKDSGIASFLTVEKTGFCVKECPGKTGKAVECAGAFSVVAKVDNKQLGCVADGAGKFGQTDVYNTRSMMKFCLPRTMMSDSKVIFDDMMKELQGGTVGQYVVDIYNASAPIGICIATGFVYCLLFIGLMSWFAEPICWFVVFLTQIGLIGLPVLFGYKWYALKELVASANTPELMKEQYNSQAALYLAGAIGAGLCALLFMAFIMCFYKSLKLAIDVVDASADFIMCTKRILFVPFAYFVFMILLVMVWFVGYMGVVSMNKISAGKYISNIKSIEWSGDNRWYELVMFFGLVWILIIVNYAQNFVILYSSATYYFNSPEDVVDENGNKTGEHKDGSAEVCQGAKLAHFKHLGGIVFGALIITIIKFLRFFFVYLANQAVKASGQEDTCLGKIAKCFIACGDCILRCFEKICDYINNSAYAYQAITGKNFCVSAWEGFFLNMKHAAAFGSAKYFAETLIFLGKFGVTTLNCFTLIGVLKGMKIEGNTTGPIILTVFFTWMSCEIWLSIFDKAILGIMTAYAVDFDVNNGEPIRGPETFNNKRQSFQEKEKIAEEEKAAKRRNSMKEGGLLQC